MRRIRLTGESANMEQLADEISQAPVLRNVSLSIQGQTENTQSSLRHGDTALLLLGIPVTVVGTLAATELQRLIDRARARGKITQAAEEEEEDD